MTGGFADANSLVVPGSQVSAASRAAGSTQLLGPSMTVRGVPADLTVGTQVLGVCATAVAQTPIFFLHRREASFQFTCVQHRPLEVHPGGDLHWWTPVDVRKRRAADS